MNVICWCATSWRASCPERARYAREIREIKRTDSRNQTSSGHPGDHKPRCSTIMWGDSEALEATTVGESSARRRRRYKVPFRVRGSLAARSVRNLRRDLDINYSCNTPAHTTNASAGPVEGVHTYSCTVRKRRTLHAVFVDHATERHTIDLRRHSWTSQSIGVNHTREKRSPSKGSVQCRCRQPSKVSGRYRMSLGSPSTTSSPPL